MTAAPRIYALTDVYPSSAASSAALPPAAAVLTLTTRSSAKAKQRDRASGFRPGARQATPAERLYPDHRADLVAVHIGVADTHARDNPPLHGFDARVHAKRQREAGAVDRIKHRIEPIGSVADHMQHRSEHFSA